MESRRYGVQLSFSTVSKGVTSGDQKRAELLDDGEKSEDK